MTPTTTSNGLNTGGGDRQPPICALPECDKPVSKGKNRTWNRCCCIEHGRIVSGRASSIYNRCIDLAKLRSLAEAGTYAREIARILNVTPESVWASARRHGIQLGYDPLYRTRGSSDRRWQEKDAALVVLYDSGITFREIAEKLDETIGAVAARLYRLDYIGKRRPPKTVSRPQSEFPGFGRCVFPHGHLPEMTFCGAEVEDITKPYCAHHRAVAYRPATAMHDYVGAAE